MSERISVIVPVFNERENLSLFFDELWRVLETSREDFEIIFVDDGSTDGSAAFLEPLPERSSRIRLVQFRRNYGQTAAIAAGFDFAGGKLLIPIDADLQNDPEAIPAILAKLREGFDVVSCWRRNRMDGWLSRRVPSRVANVLISWISGVRLHDYGCTLKGYRREVVEQIRLYGEMHRFIPIYASWAGARLTELAVNHRPRLHGRSKYTIGRTYKVILDMITVKMLGSYTTRPMHLFGGVGLLACCAGVWFAAWTLFDKFVNGIRAHNNPLLLLAVFLFILGVQFFLMGLVAELLIRTYFESTGRAPYLVRKTWNCGCDTAEERQDKKQR